MAMKTGEIYHCPNDTCGCEIEVTRGADEGGGEAAPQCCCGMPMKLSYGGRDRADIGETPVPEATPF
ncbi:MAG: hypothetical protein IT366_01645 [Candidatus Hydrogenedentes bacterium]|nr:hypothetical protein [Candidatus Hydrogenedentota bacterium]